MIWPAWVYCTRYSDRPSAGPRAKRTRKKEGKSSIKIIEINDNVRCINMGWLMFYSEKFLWNQNLDKKANFILWRGLLQKLFWIKQHPFRTNKYGRLCTDVYLCLWFLKKCVRLRNMCKSLKWTYSEGLKRPRTAFSNEQLATLQVIKETTSIG